MSEHETYLGDGLYCSFDAYQILCLSKIKSEHIRGTIRRGSAGKEYVLPSSRCAIGARPYPRARLIIVASVRFQNPAQMCLA